MAVFAFGLSVELGVDIERISSFPEMNELAAANFTPAEVMELDCRPESVRVANFYKLWTRKEAVLKACGDGLAIALNRVDVSKPAGEVGQWSVSRIEGDGLKRRFRFMDVAVAPGFAVAVAAANGDQDLSISTHHYVARIDTE
mgnify:FL=1